MQSTGCLYGHIVMVVSTYKYTHDTRSTVSLHIQHVQCAASFTMLYFKTTYSMYRMLNTCIACMSPYNKGSVLQYTMVYYQGGLKIQSCKQLSHCTPCTRCTTCFKLIVHCIKLLQPNNIYITYIYIYIYIYIYNVYMIYVLYSCYYPLLHAQQQFPIGFPAGTLYNYYHVNNDIQLS